MAKYSTRNDFEASQTVTESETVTESVTETDTVTKTETSQNRCEYCISIIRKFK